MGERWASSARTAPFFCRGLKTWASFVDAVEETLGQGSEGRFLDDRRDCIKPRDWRGTLAARGQARSSVAPALRKTCAPARLMKAEPLQLLMHGRARGALDGYIAIGLPGRLSHALAMLAV